ncbi:MAG TPA: hypothetical protein VHZ33_39840 [Trebonia sp.]|nr:hypothetical protein [Trebonia sp.]
MTNNGMNDNDRNQGYQPTASYGAARAGRPSGRRRLIAGATAAAVLVGGAAFGAVTMLTGGPAAAATGPTGQAAVLNTALTTADNPAAAVGAAAAHRHGHHPLRRLRRLGGIDGQFTFETKTGPKTLAFERGTIASVAGSDVVVRAKNGATWTWTLVTDSVVRERGQKTTASALHPGEQVFVGGPVVSGTRDARLIVIRTPHKKAATTPATTTPS